MMEHKLVNFIYAMICCNVFIGALFLAGVS